MDIKVIAKDQQQPTAQPINDENECERKTNLLIVTKKTNL